MMSERDTGQVSQSAAQIYEEFFVPALFQQWAAPIIESAGIAAGDHVLDVACGTGVLTRAIDTVVGASGSVIGLDINAGMLAVAKERSPQIDWVQHAAESLPYADNRFDVVTCQFALMFFEDRSQALQEMMRVLKPKGRLVIAVWDSLDQTLGYDAMVALLQQHFGDSVANGLRAPFCLGDKQVLQKVFSEASISQITINTHSGTALFPSIESWVYTDIKGWVMDDMLEDAQFDAFIPIAQRELARFVMPEGHVAFDAPAHIVTIQKS